MKEENDKEKLTLDEILDKEADPIGDFFGGMFYFLLIIFAFAINPILGIIVIVWGYNNR